MTYPLRGLAFAGLTLLSGLPLGVAQGFQLRDDDWTMSLDTTLS